MNTKIALESMAMDLKRVALGYHRGSEKMAERFIEEAMKRKQELDYSLIKPYIRNLLEELDANVTQKDKARVAESCLLMSILFQNYTQVSLNNNKLEI